jgi:hypothetical protein
MNDAERDAWLREALRHAPDADAVPPSGVSEAILLKARAAARGGLAPRHVASRGASANPLTALWDWLARPPVAAGFASVMAATLVGLMWWDRPMDESMPRPPAATAGRNEAVPPLAPAAPANVAAPPAPRVEAAKATTPSEGNASAKAADDGNLQRRQAGALKPSAAADAKGAAAAAPAEKRKADSFAKERALVAEAKKEAPAPFPALPPDREAQATGSLDAATNDVAKKTDEARRSHATDAVERAAAPPAAQSVAPATAPPAAATPAPFSEFAQRQRALSESRAKDGDGVAGPAPKQAAAPSTAPLRNEAERGQLDKAQTAESGSPAGAAMSADPAARANATARADAPSRVVSPSRTGSAVAATPLAPVLAAIAADPARWSRRTAAGEAVALDAAWRAWLSELDSAAAGRWRALDGAAASLPEADAGRDAAAGRVSATTLRLFSDGRLAAVVRVDAATVQLDAAPGAGGGRWQAALSPADAVRLRTTSRRLAP